MTHCCEPMQSCLSERHGIVYVARFREYGVRVLDGGSSYIEIGFCPWCGEALPSSLRDEWFDQLEALGLEPGDPRIPDAMNSDVWWRSRST